jgi:ubiquinone/menaquinone biosynthesis C-methylase UbiE
VDIDTLNKRFYEKPQTVMDYVRETPLWPEEKFIFEQHQSKIRDKSLLDIGCGGGRTTRVLRHWTSQYTGLDYSHEMIKACREKWPDLKFVHGDASVMHMFGPDQFDFVLFSFNGIDSLSHEKRIRVLQEVYRVLKPGGVFTFSSHNRDCKRIVTALDLRDLNIKNNVRNLRSYFTVRQYQVRAPTYTILSDPLAGFGCLMYYIRKFDQVKQLEAIGFRDVAIVNRKVQWVDSISLDRKSQWFHYICNKPGVREGTDDSIRKGSFYHLPEST